MAHARPSCILLGACGMRPTDGRCRWALQRTRARCNGNEVTQWQCKRQRNAKGPPCQHATTLRAPKPPQRTRKSSRNSACWPVRVYDAALLRRRLIGRWLLYGSGRAPREAGACGCSAHCTAALEAARELRCRCAAPPHCARQRSAPELRSCAAPQVALRRLRRRCRLGGFGAGRAGGLHGVCRVHGRAFSSRVAGGSLGDSAVRPRVMGIAACLRVLTQAPYSLRYLQASVLHAVGRL